MVFGDIYRLFAVNACIIVISSHSRKFPLDFFYNRDANGKYSLSLAAKTSE